MSATNHCATLTSLPLELKHLVCAYLLDTEHIITVERTPFFGPEPDPSNAKLSYKRQYDSKDSSRGILDPLSQTCKSMQVEISKWGIVGDHISSFAFGPYSPQITTFKFVFEKDIETHMPGFIFAVTKWPQNARQQQMTEWFILKLRKQLDTFKPLLTDLIFANESKRSGVEHYRPPATDLLAALEEDENAISFETELIALRMRFNSEADLSYDKGHHAYYEERANRLWEIVFWHAFEDHFWVKEKVGEMLACPPFVPEDLFRRGSVQCDQAVFHLVRRIIEMRGLVPFPGELEMLRQRTFRRATDRYRARYRAHNPWRF